MRRSTCSARASRPRRNACLKVSSSGRLIALPASGGVIEPAWLDPHWGLSLPSKQSPTVSRVSIAVALATSLRCSLVPLAGLQRATRAIASFVALEVSEVCSQRCGKAERNLDTIRPRCRSLVVSLLPGIQSRPRLRCSLLRPAKQPQLLLRRERFTSHRNILPKGFLVERRRLLDHAFDAEVTSHGLTRGVTDRAGLFRIVEQLHDSLGE